MTTSPRVALGRTPGEDPSVLSWRVALAPRPRYVAGSHWWRDLVSRTYRDARDARDRLRQSGQVASGRVAGTANSDVAYYQLSDDEFDQAVPRVTFAEVLEGLSSGRLEPGPW